MRKKKTSAGSVGFIPFEDRIGPCCEPISAAWRSSKHYKSSFLALHPVPVLFSDGMRLRISLIAASLASSCYRSPRFSCPYVPKKIPLQASGNIRSIFSAQRVDKTLLRGGFTTQFGSRSMFATKSIRAARKNVEDDLDEGDHADEAQPSSSKKTSTARKKRKTVEADDQAHDEVPATADASHAAPDVIVIDEDSPIKKKRKTKKVEETTLEQEITNEEDEDATLPSDHKEKVLPRLVKEIQVRSSTRKCSMIISNAFFTV